MTAQADLTTFSDTDEAPDTENDEETRWLLQRPESDAPLRVLESEEEADRLLEKYRESGVEDIGLVRTSASNVEVIRP